MKMEYITLFVSFASILVAGFALGWNVYRDILLKPRVQVKYRIMRTTGGNKKGQDLILITGLNKGPGIIKFAMIHYDKSTTWQRFCRKGEQGIIIYDYTNPMSSKLPCRVEVGDEVSLIFSVTETTSWAKEIHRIGLLDTFGRTHWCKKNDAREVREQYIKVMNRVTSWNNENNAEQFH